MKSDLPMTPKRRDWIRSAGAVAVAIATPAWLVAGPVINPVVRPPAAGALEALDPTTARSMLGQQFEVVSAEGYAVCELARVDVLGNPDSGSRLLTQFVMNFRPIASQGPLNQDTYHVHHPVMGTFDLLLVPHVNARGETMLLATFARF